MKKLLALLFLFVFAGVAEANGPFGWGGYNSCSNSYSFGGNYMGGCSSGYLGNSCGSYMENSSSCGSYYSGSYYGNYYQPYAIYSYPSYPVYSPSTVVNKTPVYNGKVVTPELKPVKPKVIEMPRPF